jgi:hypothetical protein
LALLLFFRSGVHGQSFDSADRFGVGVVGEGISDYDVEQLRASWYVDWGAREDPPHPAGMEYVQMVRLHQKTLCWPTRTRDRTACPYLDEYVLTYPGSLSEVASIAQSNPGSLWLIGNEMDRRDWEGGGQDEMLPELYAQAYYDLYHFIKASDPTARIAIGAVVQPTPLRLEYLDKVVAEYESITNGDMIPVDVWNIHNMILREVIYQYGADIPPGSDAFAGGNCKDEHSEPRQCTYEDADDIGLFQQQILDFRQWMKDKGERNKPLIISEYSVLYGKHQGFDYQRVKDYLYATFDYLTTATDTQLGYPADGNRLVQRWAWYSLNDTSFEGALTHHHLFTDTFEIVDLGVDYSNYVNALCYGSDIDCDCDVDVADIQMVAGRWRCESGEPCYYAWYDLDGDQVVSVVDIMQVAADWSWACP